MEKRTYQPQVPDVMEAIFDAAYLLFDLVAAILFFIFSQGKPLFILYGILTLTLCGGDAFHLVPRIVRAVHGSSDRIKRQLGIGLQVSSITMTVFYIILMYIWKSTFPELHAPAAIEAVIWLSAAVRIVICMFPQNRWCSDEGNRRLSILRNAVFAVTGIGVILLYCLSGNTYGYHMTRMVAAILHPGYIVQQEKTNGGSSDDSKDLCLYVDDRNGTSAIVTANLLFQMGRAF